MVLAKTVLITGCSENGIGAAVATEYQKRGYHVFATARSTNKIPQSLISASNVTVMTLDVTDEKSIAKAVAKVSKVTNGKLDVLVNNSGAAFSGPILDTNLSIMRNMLEVNVLGIMAVMQGFQKLLVDTPKSTIVNNSSINGECNLPYSGAYGASKAATTILSEPLRLEVASLGIRVVTLITGIVETNLHANEPEHRLPGDSCYKITEQWLQDRRSGKNRPTGMSATDYAKQFVDRVEGGARGKTYIGPLTSIFRYVQWWTPTFLWDIVMTKASPPNMTKIGLERKAP